MASQVAFRKSLLGRSILFGMLPASIVVAAVVALNGLRAWNGFTTTLEQDLRGATEAAASMINAENERALRQTEVMAIAQEAGLFGKRAESLRLIRQVLEANPSHQAVSIAYEPNGDGGDARGAYEGVPAEALGEGGRFFAYYKRDPKSASGYTFEPLQETEDDDGWWYAWPKARFERSGVKTPLLTKPYDYLGTDIIETIAPFSIDGRFAGIVGIDRSLASIQARLATLAKELDADIFLEARGDFVAATTDSDHSVQLRKTAVAQSDLAEVFAAVPAKGLSLETRLDPQTKTQCYFVSTTIPAGEWRLVVRKPTSAVLAALLNLLVLNGATAAGGIAVIVTLLAFGAVATSRRVRAAQGAAERISSGDLSRRVSVMSGSDESTELVRSMARMNDELAAIVGSVRAAAQRLASTSVELAATSRQQGATAAGFGSSTMQIAAAIREISSTGAEILRTVQSVDAGARRTSESASAGRSSLEQLAQSISRLDGATDEINDRLQVISEKAEAINSVVVTITKVADQTNLLSVNAAIEAEKAGDAGLGFLVVAREIRRLADQTASATLDIERIVRHMQDAVSSGVQEMARFTGEMRGSTVGVQRLTGSLGVIIEEMHAAASGFSQVQQGMANQSAGVTQIDQAVRQVAEGAQQTVASVSEFGRVAEELAHAVAVLQDAVGRFNLEASANDAAELPSTPATNAARAMDPARGGAH